MSPPNDLPRIWLNNCSDPMHNAHMHDPRPFYVFVFIWVTEFSSAASYQAVVRMGYYIILPAGHREWSYIPSWKTS